MLTCMISRSAQYIRARSPACTYHKLRQGRRGSYTCTAEDTRPGLMLLQKFPSPGTYCLEAQWPPLGGYKAAGLPMEGAP